MRKLKIRKTLKYFLTDTNHFLPFEIDYSKGQSTESIFDICIIKVYIFLIDDDVCQLIISFPNEEYFTRRQSS